MTRRHSPLLAGLAMVILAAGASSAQAATINATAECYVNVDPTHGAPMTIVGAGFTPGDQVEVRGGREGTTFSTGTADASGAVSITTTAPLLTTSAPAVERQPITMQDESGVGTSASTTVLTANLALSVTPSYASPGRPRTYRFSGFRAAQVIYAHYLHRGHVVKSVAFGRTAGPCGTLKTRKLLYPGGHPHAVRYDVQFDDSRAYHRSATPRIRTHISFAPR